MHGFGVWRSGFRVTGGRNESRTFVKPASVRLGSRLVNALNARLHGFLNGLGLGFRV